MDVDQSYNVASHVDEEKHPSLDDDFHSVFLMSSVVPVYFPEVNIDAETAVNSYAFYAKKQNAHNNQQPKLVHEEEHTTASSNLIPTRTIKTFLCSCSRQCHMKIPEKRQLELHEHYNNLPNLNVQSCYLYNLIRLIEKRRMLNNHSFRQNCTRVYFLPDENGRFMEVCKSFFKSIFCISDGRITYVINNKPSVSILPDRQDLNENSTLDKIVNHQSLNETPEIKVHEVCSFIMRYPECHEFCNQNRIKKRKPFASNFTLTKLYELYSTEYSSPVSQNVFNQIFTNRFNFSFNISVSNNRQNYPKPVGKIKEVQSDGNIRSNVSSTTLRIDVEISRCNPEEVHVVAFDLTKTLPTPRLPNVTDRKQLLWTYCLHICDLTDNQSYVYLWHEGIASSGIEEIGSCLLHFMQHFVTSRRIILYSAPLLSKMKMISFCLYVVSSSDFPVEIIEHKFLMKEEICSIGNEEMDLFKKVLSSESQIFIPGDWEIVIKSVALNNPLIVVRISSFYSTSSFDEIISKRKFAEEGETIPWFQINVLYYQKAFPFTVYYKTLQNDLVHFINVKKKTSKIRTLQEVKLEILYHNGHFISNEKKNDLISLLQFIPSVHHEFYQNLSVRDPVENLDVRK